MYNEVKGKFITERKIKMEFNILKQNAKEQIKGKIGILFVINLIATICIIVASAIVRELATFIISPPLNLGLMMIFLKMYNFETPEVADLFKGFKHIANAILLQILSIIFIFLWSLLFIIPGIIKSFSYSMAFYILAENPHMSAIDALNESKRIMEGHKMEYFILSLSFIGWAILCTITAGIAAIYAAPYMNMTYTNFYKSISNSNTYQGSAKEYTNASPEL